MLAPPLMYEEVSRPSRPICAVECTVGADVVKLRSSLGMSAV